MHKGFTTRNCSQVEVHGVPPHMPHILHMVCRWFELTSESTHLPKDPQLTASLQEGFGTNSCTCQMLLIRVATCSTLNCSNKAWKVFMNLGSTSLTAKLSLSAELRKKGIEIPGTWVPPSRRQSDYSSRWQPAQQYTSPTRQKKISRNWLSLAGDLLSTKILKQGTENFFKPGSLKSDGKAVIHQRNDLLNTKILKQGKEALVNMGSLSLTANLSSSGRQPAQYWISQTRQWKLS